MAGQAGRRKGSTSKERDTTKEVSETWQCDVCKKEFKDENSKMLECERCEKYHCAKCMKINEDVYDLLTQRKDFHWYCGGCEPKVLQSIQLEKEIERKLAEFTTKVDYKLKTLEGNVHKKLGELEEKFNERLKEQHRVMDDTLLKVKEDMISRIKEVQGQAENQRRQIVEVKEKVVTKEELDKAFVQQTERLTENNKPESFADIVKQQLEEQMGHYNESLQHVQTSIEETRVKSLEERDKENRVRNVIIYRAPESQETRFDERQKADRDFCKKLITEGLDLEFRDDDIQKTIRLGKKDEDTTIRRPLLVEFRSRMQKNEIMESLNKLKNVEAVYKQLSIAHDMTQRERDQCRTLVEEAKQKEAQETGNYIYRVRGQPGAWRMIKIKTGQN